MKTSWTSNFRMMQQRNILTLVFVFICIGWANAGIIISMGSTLYYERYAGESVTFNCTVTTDSPTELITSITWYFGNKVLNLGERSSGGNPDQPSLTIKNLTNSDAGSYICSANSSTETKNGTLITLGIRQSNLPSSVQINSGSSSISVNNGGNLTLDCTASGSPAPDFTWTKDSSQVLLTGSPYTVARVTSNDAGQYTCTATNVAGSTSVSVTVVVITAPSSVFVTPTSVTVDSGNQFTLTCNANGSPSQNYVWYKDTIAIGITSQTYTVVSASSSDSGSYKCQASNNAGSLASSDIVVTVNVPIRPSNGSISSVPSNGQINEGGSINLTCRAEGTSPTYSWSRDTDSTTWNGNSVSISNAGELDDALYICRAYNDAGSVWVSFSITVIFSPKNVTISPASLTVSAGDPIMLICNSDGTSPTFSWTEGSRSFTGSNLTIASASQSDSGTYICQATNSAGSRTSAITIVVHFSPQTVTISPSSLSVNSSDLIQLTCSADGLPTPTYKWYKGSSSWNGQTLSIVSAAGSDAGVYACEASNSVGGKNATIVVNVAITAPFNISISPQTVSIYSGQSLEMTCAADGSEPLIYLWTRDSDNSTWSNQTLIISPASVADAGIYFCETSNFAGSVNKSAIVNVITPDSVQNLRIIPSKEVVNQGDFVQFTCSGNSSTPVIYTWSKGDNSWSGPVLNITSATVSDGGFYICQATNLAGSSFATYVLNVVLPPQNTTISATSLSVLLGDPIIITCESDGTEPLNYTWTKDDQTWTGQLLNISSSKVTDTGVYICEVANTAGSVTTSVNVTIVYSPRTVTITPSSPTVEEDGFISIVCNADGIPTPSYDWIKDGAVLMHGSTLNISSASATNDGDYVCQASNDYGSANQTVTVNVIIYNAPQVVTVVPSTLSINSGETIQLTCSADGSPFQNFTWIKGDNSWTGSVLTIDGTTTSDNGNYTCRASNPAGSLNTTASVFVFVSPSSVTINPPSLVINSGDSILLNCSANGTPSQTYVWYKGDNSWEGSVLNITSASLSDTGVYVCQASNMAGSLNASAEVIVYGSPKNITITATELSINSGETIDLSCHADGSPTQTYTWYHGDNMWMGQTLTVAMVIQSDSGMYTCQSSNQAGSLNTSVEVTVYSAPQNVTISPSAVTVNTSDFIQLTCSADGLPTQSFRWIKGDNSWNGSSLNFTSVSVFDAGTYICEAFNQAGSANTSVIMTVTVQGYLPPTSVTITTASNTDQVAEGGSVELICNGNGSPSQTYSWSKNIDTWSGQSLNITSATLSDDGIYICQATNPAGSAFGSFRLTIVVAPSMVNVTPSVVTVTSGQTLQLTCSGDGIPASSQNYTWSMGNRVWHGDILTIQAASTLDIGVFTCQASNIAGSESSIANVYVNYSPSNFQFNKVSPLSVIEGQTIQVTCSSSGSPTPTYYWSKGGTNYTGATLNIPNAAKSNDGIYICNGKNSAGSQTASFEVDIQYAPEVTTSSKAVSATDGQTVSLTCTANANPAASLYEWTCQGSTTNQTGSVYSMSVSGTNSIQCSCKAFNTIGASASQTFNVTVAASGTGNIGAATASSGLSAGEIAAICLAILFVVLVIIIVLVCCWVNGVCAKICGKKEKAKVEPSEKKEIVHHVEIPRFEEKPRIRVPSAVTRKDVTLSVNQDNMFEEENFEINTKYELVAPGTHRSANGTIISLNEHRSPRANQLPALDLNYEEEERRRRRRRKKRKKHHHHREPAEGMESPHRPRESSRSRRERHSHRDSRERIVDDDMYHSRYAEDGDLVVIPGPEYNYE